MSRDDVIRMALESGFAYRPTDDHLVVEEVHGYSEVVVTAGLERFAALVAAHEREECAAACGNLQLAHAGRADLTADQCADAIRARGDEELLYPTTNPPTLLTVSHES